MSVLDDAATTLAGQLLVAMPSMPDERFAHSVIYLCAYSEEGAMGLVINRVAQNVSFPNVIEQLGITASIDVSGMPVHIGGPVESGRGFVLHSADYVRDSTMLINERTGLTATIDILKALAGGEGPERAVFALGYAGWGPGQLDREIQANGWLIAPPDDEILYADDPENKWHAALERLGVQPGLLSNTAGHA